MVTNDKQIQHNTLLSDDKKKLEIFFRDDKGSKTYLLVAKIKDQQPPIYSGFMKYSIEKKIEEIKMVPILMEILKL
jgi:hypothetical protein